MLQSQTEYLITILQKDIDFEELFNKVISECKTYGVDKYRMNERIINNTLIFIDYRQVNIPKGIYNALPRPDAIKDLIKNLLGNIRYNFKSQVIKESTRF
ncbi:hypothetical protein DBR32_02895 [Taibaiella sp. KBW10]|uniref:hypothetical protein n=1 Tax=Taibaiella sp. KBW10 TaxID=2153357 RepID=UPI000F5A9948|nr:hypothetical protein [Taibaiella sp. KBW10]RQO32559.1 hypothetical protein DBR32_02895 [Taibaiella sp. KBW10]